MKRTFITPLLFPLIISSSFISPNKVYAVEKNVSTARLRASIDIGNINCVRDTFGEGFFETSYEETYKNIIKRHDKDNSLRIKEFVNSESGKKVIDSFTSYDKNWSNCNIEAGIKKNKKYNTSGKTADELKKIYVYPVFPLLKVDLDKENQLSSNKVTDYVSNRRDLAASLAGSFVCILEKFPTEGKVANRNGNIIDLFKSISKDTDQTTEEIDKEAQEIIYLYLKRDNLEDQFEWIKSKDGTKVVYAYADFWHNFPKCKTNKSGNNKQIIKLMNKHVKPYGYLLDKPLEVKKEEKESPNFLQNIFPKKSAPKTKAEDKARKKCLKAKDYAGCMEYEANR